MSRCRRILQQVASGIKSTLETRLRDRSIVERHAATPDVGFGQFDIGTSAREGKNNGNQDTIHTLHYLLRKRCGKKINAVKIEIQMFGGVQCRPRSHHEAKEPATREITAA